jgi:hypothetical protein
MTNELIISEFGEALTIERQPDLSFTHHFIGLRIHKSECKVEIWKLPTKCVILFTDTNKGTSVTNAAEQLITEIYNQYLIKDYKTNQCLFAETYDKVKEGIDIILPEWHDNICEDIEWRHLGKFVK